MEDKLQIDPKNINSNPKPRGGVKTVVVVISLVCLLVGAGLVAIRWGGQNLNKRIASTTSLTDPLAYSNPTDGISEFLSATLKADFLPNNSLTTKEIDDRTLQYRWNYGSVIFTARISMVDPIESTNSGKVKVGMILVAARVQTDKELSQALAREYLGQYFRSPTTETRDAWMEYDDKTNGVGRTVALKWENYLGSREWRGMIFNPPDQKGPIYLYSLQACKFFPGNNNFEDYKCVNKSK